jgi:hypothetical protein
MKKKNGYARRTAQDSLVKDAPKGKQIPFHTGA